MVLATCTQQQPSQRIVSLRGVDHGFLFYTNCQSRKGQELALNDRASLLFYWREEGRQLRVEGRVEEAEAIQVDRYFASRPTEAKLTAWASRQSQPLAGPHELGRAVEQARERFAQTEPHRPPWWRGYRLVPHGFEFWTSGPHRRHQRVTYQRRDGVWDQQMLFP